LRIWRWSASIVLVVCRRRGERRRGRRGKDHCTQACGKTASIASGKPFSPSTQQTKTSWTPRCLSSVSTASQNLAPSAAWNQRPSVPGWVRLRSEQRLLTFNATRDRTSAWTADGTQIVYDKEFSEIYAINADGSGGERKLADGLLPGTSPHGSKIVFSARARKADVLSEPPANL